MTRQCPQDPTEVFSDDEAMCATHICPLVVVGVDEITPALAHIAAGPAPGARPERTTWSVAVCWRCGTESPNSANVECLNVDCRRSLTPPAMHIRFPRGEVEVRPGENVNLGRQGPHGQVFRDYPNVSRRHAAVGVDHDGRAWIVPFAVSNGTFLNDQELPDSLNRTLASGDRIRFAAGAAVGAVTLYER